MNIKAKITRIGELREGTSKTGRIYKARDIEFKTGIDVFKGGLSGDLAQLADDLVVGREYDISFVAKVWESEPDQHGRRWRRQEIDITSVS